MLVMSNSSLEPGRERQRSRGFRGGWLLCFLATLAWPAYADTKLEVIEATVAVDDGVYELDVPQQARRAIEAGLTLHMRYDIEVARVRRYVPDAEVASLQQSYELSYHALSQRY